MFVRYHLKGQIPRPYSSSNHQNSAQSLICSGSLEMIREQMNKWAHERMSGYILGAFLKNKF